MARFLRLVVKRSCGGARRDRSCLACPWRSNRGEMATPLGIAYDPKNDVLEIALDGVDHLINSPKEVWVDAGAGELLSFEVIDGEGVSQIIQLREPLMLPPPLPQS